MTILCLTHVSQKSSIDNFKFNRIFYESKVLYNRYFSRGLVDKLPDTSLLAEYRNIIQSLLLRAADEVNTDGIKNDIKYGNYNGSKVVSYQKYYQFIAIPFQH